MTQTYSLWVLVTVALAPSIASAFGAPDLPDAHLEWRRLALGLAGLLGFLLGARRGSYGTGARVILLWCSFLSWALLSASLSATPARSLLVVGTWFSALGVAWGAAACRSARPGRNELALGTWGFLLAACGLAHSFSEGSLGRFAMSPWPYGNLSLSASLVALTIPYQLSIGLHHGARRGRVLAATGLLLSLSFVLLSSVRAAWLAAAGGYLFVASTSRAPLSRRGLTIAGPLVALSLLWVLPAPLWSVSPGREPVPFRERLLSLGAPTRGTVQERLILWENTIRAAANSPVTGVGPGRFPQAYPAAVEEGRPHRGTSLAVHRAPRFAHSDPLQAWLEIGAPGLALGLLGLGLAAFRMRGSATWASLGAFALLSLSLFPLYLPSALAFLALAIGLGGRNEPGRARAPRRLPSLLGLVVSFLLVGMLSAHLLRSVQYEAALARGDARAASRFLDPESEGDWKRLSAVLADAGRFEEALAASARALELDAKGLNTIAWHGNLLASAGRTDLATTVLRRANPIQPESVEIRLRLAEIASLEHGLSGAAPFWEQLVRAIPWIRQTAVWRIVGSERLERAEDLEDEVLFRRAEEAFNRGLSEPGASPVERCLCAIGKARVHLGLRSTERWNEEFLPVVEQIYPSIQGELGRTQVSAAVAALREKAIASAPQASVRILDRLRTVIERR